MPRCNRRGNAPAEAWYYFFKFPDYDTILPEYYTTGNTEYQRHFKNRSSIYSYLLSLILNMVVVKKKMGVLQNDCNTP
jgi:hypothetical protein